MKQKSFKLLTLLNKLFKVSFCCGRKNGKQRTQRNDFAECKISRLISLLSFFLFSPFLLLSLVYITTVTFLFVTLPLCIFYPSAIPYGKFGFQFSKVSFFHSLMLMFLFLYTQKFHKQFSP